MSSARRGISMIWVILAVFLSGAAAITAYLQYLEAATHRELLAKSKEIAAKVEKDRRDKTFKQIQAICRLAGWPFEQEGQIEATVNLLKDRVEARKTQYALPGKAMAMYELIHAAEINYIKAKNRRDTARQYKKEGEGNAELSRNTIADYTRLKDAEIAEQQALLQVRTDAQTEDVRRYELRKGNLEAESTKLTDAKTALEKEQRDELTRLANEINRLDTALKELVKQEAVFHDLTETQGKIVDPHQDDKYAYITLGARDRIVRGMKFVVFVREFGGNVRWKGEVEVKDVEERQSKVSITRTEDMFDPIIEGDVIFNPLYNPARPKRVALVGDFGKTKYTKDQAAARIRAIGSIVDEQVGDNTDFIVVGESYQTDANFEKANQLSVPWRPAFEIFEFLGD